MQPKMESVRITCLKCNGVSNLRIINNTDVMYVDHTPIISCRLRGDLKWGFQCMCGNDSRLAAEELPQVEVLHTGSKQAIKKLIKSLEIKDENKFRMEPA